MADIDAICIAAREAGLLLAPMDVDMRNCALEAMAVAIESEADEILAANTSDTGVAEKMVDAGKMSQPILKRLVLTEAKIADMARGVRAVAALPDPLGRVSYAVLMDEGLGLRRVSCPLGVIAAIFESRPDALVQIASLCVKSGNAVVLKGGHEALGTNRTISETIRRALAEGSAIPANAIQFVEAREDIHALLSRESFIDLIIPRGSNEFVSYIKEHSRIPVLGHADGICHLYVDKAASLDMAVSLTVDSKTQYVAVCNSVETILVHQEVARNFLPRVAEALQAKGVELRGCMRTMEIIANVVPASEIDWETEYLDLILSVRVVDNLNEAVAHINHYGSRHTEAIVTADESAAESFFSRVDAASVMWNASTRFADGYRFGLGAEVGISTDKVHARGPVGLEGLLIYKYMLTGEGHIVSEYEGEQARSFLHRPLPLDSDSAYSK